MVLAATPQAVANWARFIPARERARLRRSEKSFGVSDILLAQFWHVVTLGELNAAILRGQCTMVTPDAIDFKNLRFPELRGKGGRPVSALRKASIELGCGYSHLWRVATGRRESPELLARYHAWCEATGNPCASVSNFAQ